ncbi:hypothetical protein O3Q51_08800 [Cryomorphaceae bacterium 1068]|nr:hypothetical protein [Cryomorphaceae bacterium 1068]
MKSTKHLYIFDYHHTERDLCKLESKHVFGEEVGEKLLWSNTLIHPSSSTFIKKRLDIMATSQDYGRLLTEIEAAGISAEGFKVEYLVFDGDNTRYPQRLNKLRDIGFRIEGIPDYHNPKSFYALCQCDGTWTFGKLIKDRFDWYKHKEKPRSYSNSITIGIAKALVNIAAKGKKEATLLDACCGVGTILMEACYAGYAIEGCDFNWKICADARENLAYFDYSATVHCSDIGGIDKRYDAAIVDLPYNLLSDASEADIAHIIASAGRLTDRMVIVSTSDISDLISKAGFRTADHCSVSKKGKRNFARRVWVCVKKVV